MSIQRAIKEAVVAPLEPPMIIGWAMKKTERVKAIRIGDIEINRKTIKVDIQK